MAEAFNQVDTMGASPENVSTPLYTNPYLDLASTYHPTSVKELLGLSKTWFYGQPMIKAVVSKYAEYPVTKILYNDPNEDLCDKWKYYFEDILKIRSYDIHAGLNYYAMGNHIMSIRFPTRRKFVCNYCLTETWEDDAKDWDFRFPYFYMYCPKCRTKQRANAIDHPVVDYNKISLISWDPLYIYLNWSQEFPEKSKYYLKVPPYIKRKIIQGYKHQITAIPALYIEAVRKRRLIELNKNNLFHMKSYTLAEEDMAWGKPLAMAVFKKVHYTQVLNKSQEAIAQDRANPTDVFFPQSVGGVDPVKHLNLSNWEQSVRKQLSRARKDITYKAIMPTPIGAQRLGGDAKALLLTPEIDAANREIAGGMGCPPEFIFGGLSWSGSSVSLRILENSFMIYREQLLSMNRWIMKRLSPYLNLPEVDLDFAEFKMADDPQQKQIALQLYGMGVISAKTMLHEWGWDWDQELEQRNAEEMARAKGQLQVIELQSKVQGKQMLLMAKYQTQANIEAGQTMEAGTKDSLYSKAKLKVESLMRQQGTRHPRVDEMVDVLVKKVMTAGPDLGMMMVEVLKEKSPNLGQMVEIKLNEKVQPPALPPGPGGMGMPGMGPEMGPGPPMGPMPGGGPPPPGAGANMTPMPEQLPPRRM